MSPRWGIRLLVVLFGLVASGLTFAAADDPPAQSPGSGGGNGERPRSLAGGNGRPPAKGLGYPYAVPPYPGYGPPPGGGWGYGRGYSGDPPAYREYRRRGGGYRQHRQHARPPLYPVPRPQPGQPASDRPAQMPVPQASPGVR